MSLPRPIYFLTAAALLVQPAWSQEAPENASDSAAALHVLNRIAYGPKPGEVEAVEKMGIRNYIEQQLHPEKIDDSQTDAEVAKFEMLQLSGPQLGTLYYDEIKAFLKQKKQADAQKIAAATPATATTAPASAPMAEVGAADSMQNGAGPMPAISTIRIPESAPTRAQFRCNGTRLSFNTTTFSTASWGSPLQAGVHGRDACIAPSSRSSSS